MKYTYGEDIKFHVEVLTINNHSLVHDFRCGNSTIDNYINDPDKCCTANNVVSYLFIDDIDQVVIGFISISCSGITHSYQGSTHTLPAIEIHYFAISNELHHLSFFKDDSLEESHYYFSDHILYTFMHFCEEISSTIIGADYILLYAVESAINFYKRIGFTDFHEYMKPDNYQYLNGCQPMYIKFDT